MPNTFYFRNTKEKRREGKNIHSIHVGRFYFSLDSEKGERVERINEREYKKKHLCIFSERYSKRELKESLDILAFNTRCAF